MKDTFAIHIRLRTPLLLGRRLNFDALLANILYGRFLLREPDANPDHLADRANAGLPLAVHHGVYAGSSAIIPRCRVSQEKIIGAIERHVRPILEPATVIQKNDRKRRNSRDYDNLGTKFRNTMNIYNVYHLQQEGLGVWFVAQGDKAAVQDLLRDVTGIGVRRNVGWGQVEEIRFYDSMASAVPGVLSESGVVLRPVPKNSGIVPSSYVTTEETVRPPYWKGERVACFAPPALTWSPAKIDELVGIR